MADGKQWYNNPDKQQESLLMPARDLYLIRRGKDLFRVLLSPL